MDYLSKTGLDSLRGADILSAVPEKYASTVEYGSDPFGRSAKGAAQVLLADVGTRICYTQHGSFDTHTNEVALQAKLWDDVAAGIRALYTDLKTQNASDDVLIFVFSEFGRRVKDNGNGTDHGSGGVAFLIGDRVKGGHYGDYPSLADDKLVEGRPGFQPRFPLPVHGNSGGLDGSRGQADRQRRLRQARLPEPQLGVSGADMRTFFTALAFLAILMAVIPAVRRSFPPRRDGGGSHASSRKGGRA